MISVVVIRHVAFEDLGSFGPLLQARGAIVQWLEAGADDLRDVQPLGPDLLVVLGGPISATDDADYPFLAREAAILEQRLKADRPTLGICLGAQMMARALGARVYPGPAKEIGWSELTLTAAGRRSCLRHLETEPTPVLHWHGDTFDLPVGAERLASTAITENQAFSWGERGLALQFHPEAEAAGLERWFIGHACEIAATAGISVPSLRADTARFATGLVRHGQRCLKDWLDRVGL